jgi:hypothetical protein
MNSIKEYLEMMINVQQKSFNQTEEFKYCSYEHFVLENGTDFGRGSEAPEDLKYGKMKQCFANSFGLAMDDPTKIYCEGWALNIIPVHHAWCLDVDTGDVVDPTWGDQHECFYYGVPFKTNFVREHALKTGIYGIFYNPKSDLGLIKGTSTGWRWNG